MTQRDPHVVRQTGKPVVLEPERSEQAIPSDGRGGNEFETISA